MFWQKSEWIMEMRYGALGAYSDAHNLKYGMPVSIPPEVPKILIMVALKTLRQQGVTY